LNLKKKRRNKVLESLFNRHLVNTFHTTFFFTFQKGILCLISVCHGEKKTVSDVRILLIFHYTLSASVNWIWEAVFADNIDFNYAKMEDIEGLMKEKEEKRNSVEKC